MPYKDDKKRKAYAREYDRKRRAAYKELQDRMDAVEKAVFGKKKKKTKP